MGGLHMRWFWKDNKKSSPELESIQQLKEQNGLLEKQFQALSEQMTKLSRLQYKTSKDIQGKVDGLQGSIDSLIKRQEEDEKAIQRRMIQAEATLVEMTHSLIRWLDDLDLVSSRMMGENQVAWKKLMQQWSEQILEQLESLGVSELQVLGSSFEPTLSEAIAPISKKEAEVKYKDIPVRADIPYQIVEVTRRGFIWKNGTLLRKAQVITLEKESFYGE